MSWPDFQREVHEHGACIALGHNWIACEWKLPQMLHAGEEMRALAWKCLRCGETARRK